jgi:hypothetical protein
MHVTNRISGKHNDNTYVTYSFDTGHEFRQWATGGYFAYTPKGNYASIPTAHKLARIASQFEDNRVQVEGA